MQRSNGFELDLGITRNRATAGFEPTVIILQIIHLAHPIGGNLNPLLASIMCTTIKDELIMIPS